MLPAKKTVLYLAGLVYVSFHGTDAYDRITQHRGHGEAQGSDTTRRPKNSSRKSLVLTPSRVLIMANPTSSSRRKRTRRRLSISRRIYHTRTRAGRSLRRAWKSPLAQSGILGSDFRDKRCRGLLKRCVMEKLIFCFFVYPVCTDGHDYRSIGEIILIRF